MKVTIRTLQQKSFEVDAEPQTTVLSLKEKVGSVQGEPPENLKLFYAGRTLSDDQKSVESLNLKENSYLVVMIIKPRKADFDPTSFDIGSSLPTFSRPEFTAPTPPVNSVSSGSFGGSSGGYGGSLMSFDDSSRPFSGSSASYGSSSAPFGNASRPFSGSSETFGGSRPFGSSRPFGGPSEAFEGTSRPYGGSSAFNAPSHNPIPKPSTVPASSAFDNNKWMSGTSMFGASDATLENSVKNLVEMGFERDQVLKALKASFGNTERAVEYLTNNIPDDEDEPDFSSFRPFGASNMSSSFTRPRPTEMVGHIEEVDPNAPEESTKPAKPDPSPSSPVTAPVEDAKTSEPTPPATISTAAPETTPVPEVAPAPKVDPTPEVAPAPEVKPTPEVAHVPEPAAAPAPSPVSAQESTPAPLPTSSKDVPLESSSGKSVSPAPPSPTLPSVPTPPSVAEFQSMNPRPTSFASSSSSMPSQPDFATLAALGAFGGGPDRENVTLESLRDDPVIQQIRELAGQNPDLIGPLLEQLVQSKPGVMGLIASNPEGLARLFMPGGGSSSRAEAKPGCISVTGEEKEAIERLESMGFSRGAVIQAYFAFNKNEEAAANFLIENEED